MLRGFASHQHWAGDIGGEYGFETRKIEVGQGFEKTDPGVVHKNVEIAELSEDVLVGSLNVFFFRDVRVNRMHAQPASRIRETLFISAGDRDSCSGGVQRVGGGASDTSRSTGDQCHLIF